MRWIVSKFTWCIYSFLNINVLTGKFLYFAFNCILHKVLWLSLYHSLQVLLGILTKLPSYLLSLIQSRRRLHPNTLPIVIIAHTCIVIQLRIWCLIYISVLASWVVISKVLMHYLSSFSLYGTSWVSNAVVYYVIHPFLFLGTATIDFMYFAVNGLVVIVVHWMLLS